MKPAPTSLDRDPRRSGQTAQTTNGALGVLLIPMLARARAGDAAALEDLLTQLYAPLLRYAVRKLRIVSDGAVLAEDIVQDAVVRIAGRLGECRAESDGQLIAWALTIVRSTGIDHFRRAGREVGDLTMSVSDRAMDHQAYLSWEREGSSSDAPQRTEQSALMRTLHESFATLPAETAELIRIKLDGQVSWAEVARTFRTTASAAKRRFQRAQATLRREVARRLDECRVPQGED